MSKFGDEFKAARAAGKKTFMFNGKSYTTKTADDMKKAAPAAPAAAKAEVKPVGRGMLNMGVSGPAPRDADARVGRGTRNTGVTGGANLAPKPVTKGPTAEQKAADADKAAAKKQKSTDDMKATQERMSAAREDKSKKLFPKMKHGGGVPKMKMGGSVRGDGCAVKGKTKGTMR